jgi:nicotinamidase-related amidase
MAPSELSLDARTTALVVIDLQQGILAGGERDPYSPAQVLERSAAMARAMRRAGGLVVLVRVAFAKDYGDTLKQPVDAPAQRPEGGLPAEWSQLAPELDLQPTDLVITKRQWGAFYGTGLELELRRRGVTTIVLCGIATSYGVESTARDGWERGFDIVFAEDAMTSSPPGAHKFAVETVFPRIGRVRSTEQVIAAL